MARNRKFVPFADFQPAAVIAPDPAAIAAAVDQSTTAEDLDKGSTQWLVMSPFWDKVDTIIGGVEAMKATKTKYLPKLPMEDQADYDFRLSCVRMTNVYRDVLENLASKPFVTAISVKDPPSEIEAFIKDVTGSGLAITQFAVDVFFSGINNALDWIFVDYPTSQATTGAPRTQADESKLGLRPYWSRIKACNVLEVRSQFINGKETLTYMRVYEPDVDGENYVRIMTSDGAVASWQLWKEDTGNTKANAKNVPHKFVLDKSGKFSIGVIPIVPFITGRRDGLRWVFDPALRDAADLQVTLYQDESSLDHIKRMAAFPMLSANGVTPVKNADGTVKSAPVGPMAVLYAPPSPSSGHPGSWTLLEPAATTLTFLETHNAKTIDQIRELGRNPLTAQAGNLTVITTAVAAQKGNSAVQMWAGALENALCEALMMTSLWLKSDYNDPTVSVFKDFDIDGEGGDAVLTMFTNMRSAGDISRTTLWSEMQRRNVLRPEFDADDEEKALLDEMPGDSEIDGNPGLPLITPLKQPVIIPPAPTTTLPPTKP